MASPIGDMVVKLDMDSTEFNKSLTGARRNLKQVSSEMRASMSSFGDSGNELNKLGSQIEGMNKKYQAQSQIVDESRQKYESLAEQYGETSVKAQNAATELNKEVSVMNNMGNEISDLESQYESLEKQQITQSKLSYKVGSQMETLGGRMQSVGKNASGLGKTLSKSVTLPIVGAGAAALGAAKKTGDYADEVINSSQKVGTSTDAYQELKYALEQTGLESSDADRALGRLNQRMGRAADGNEKYQEGLEAVGISQEDLEEGTYDTDEAFIKIIDSLQDVEDSQERSAMASEIFGTNMSRELMPAINGGSEELEKLRGQAHDAGAVMSGDALKDSQEFKSAMDDLKERGASLVHELGSKLAPVLTDKLIPAIETEVIPALETGIDKLVDAVDWFSNLDSETKKTAGKFALFVTAAGPVLSVTGKLTQGIGGVVGVAGKLSKGIAGSSGLAGALGMLGKGGIAGVAIAGIAGVAYGAKKLNDKVKESKEVNLDSAESFSDQAAELDNTSEKFNKLKDKAGLTTDELALLNDLNERISETSDPEEIAVLKDRYNELADKSGASKDELQELFDVNEDLIEQSPDVETKISEEGNQWVENTEKVDDNVRALREWSEQQLTNERTKVLQQQKESQDEINSAKREQSLIDERLKFFADHQNDSESSLQTQLEETQEKLKGKNRHKGEGKKLDAQEQDLLSLINDTEGDTVEKLQGQKSKNQEVIEKEYQRLDKLQEIDGKMSDIYLKNAGINKKGSEGLRQLEQNIEKHQQEKEELEQKRQKNGALNEKDRKRLDHLNSQLGKEQKSKQNIQDETDMYDNVNFLLGDQNEELQKAFKKKVKSLTKTEELSQEEQNGIHKAMNKNSEHDEEISKLEEKRKKEGANKDEIDEQISSLQGKKKKNNENIEKILRENDLWDDVIDAVNDTNRGLDDQDSKHQRNNSKTKTGIGLEQDRTAEAGKSVNKDVSILPEPTASILNRDVGKGLTKDVDISKSDELANLDDDVSASVTKSIDLAAKAKDSNFTIPAIGHAKGTKGHPFDGPAMLNDGKGNNAGQELVRTPDGTTGMFEGKNVVANLQKGTEVLSAKETRNVIPGYADGVGDIANYKFKEMGLSGFGDTISNMKGAFSTVTSKAVDKIKDMLTTGNYHLNEAPSGSGVKRWKPQVKKALKANSLSTSKSMVNKVLKQIETESGGNEKTVQSSDVKDINTAMGNPARGLNNSPLCLEIA